ncbi:MAG: family 1 glycosylhydrolase [Sphingomicrobium sp.]
MLDRRLFLAAAAATVTTVKPAGAVVARSSTRFPAGFLWGAATAGHQVEGNNVASDIWALEHVKPTGFVEPSGDAANSFELWPVDMDLVRNMGLNSYRFSLEWSRIEPEQGQFSIAMLDHYKKMIDGCRARGITPFVTFNHFSAPRWFAMLGGWTNDDSPALFGRFCDRAARHLADGIGYATTLNEPNLSGLLQDMLPPEIGPRIVALDRLNSAAAAKAFGVPRFFAGISLTTDRPNAVPRNLMNAHRAGRQAIKAVCAKLPVGVSLAIADDQSIGGDAARDAAREKLYAPWLRLARDDDFVGVQNYERTVWTANGKRPVPADAVKNYTGAEVYPPSLAGAVRYAHSIAGVPVIVTEHGVATSDDRVRANLIPAALTELKRAIDEGVPVMGYIHWTLIDNFEWAFGYKPTYGLHTLDRSTFARTPKPSAAVLGAIARRNAL